MLKIKLFLLVVIVAAIGFYVYHHHQATLKQAAQRAAVTAKAEAAKAAAQKLASHCVGNSLDKEVIVSISARHMWACSGTAYAYDTAVITGNENLASDLTPIGVYKIYAKQTNYNIIGSNGITSWNDYVNYSLSFLQNQYGYYAFHDATWRKASDFGNIIPNSTNASHGCVEMSLAAAKWLYNWAPIGTTVTIET